MSRFAWILRKGEVFTPPLPHMCGVMGIVNVTPDSFYDGGVYNRQDSALGYVQCLVQEGAHIVDVGAESTRPGARPLTASEEMARLMPFMQKLSAMRHAASAFPFISIDTYHAQTAAACLEAGVDIINDISACRFDPALLDIVGQYKPGYVLMHTSEQPAVMQDTHMLEKHAHKDMLDVLCQFFEYHMQQLTQAGLPEERIILDPGIGFGKSVEQNFHILRNIKKLHTLGRPVLMGLSMKSLFASLCPSLSHTQETQEQMRSHATQCAMALLAAQDACLVYRVHHVAETLRTFELVRCMV